MFASLPTGWRCCDAVGEECGCVVLPADGDKYDAAKGWFVLGAEFQFLTSVQFLLFSLYYLIFSLFKILLVQLSKWLMNDNFEDVWGQLNLKLKEIELKPLWGSWCINSRFFISIKWICSPKLLTLKTITLERVVTLSLHVSFVLAFFSRNEPSAFLLIGFYYFDFGLQQLINLSSRLPRSCIKSSHSSSSTGGGGEALPPGGCVSTPPTLATIDRKHWFISCPREQVVEPFLILFFFFSLLLSRSSGVCGLKYELLFLIRGRIFLLPPPSPQHQPIIQDWKNMLEVLFSFLKYLFIKKNIRNILLGVQTEKEHGSDPQYRSMTWRETVTVNCLGLCVRLCACAPPAYELTWLSQSLKAEVRVKTVGFFTSLQLCEETKLVTPWTYHLLSAPRQFRGPPESPWAEGEGREERWTSEEVLNPRVWFRSRSELPHARCTRTQRPLRRRSWWSWRRSPTSRCGCTRRAPPRAAGPAAAGQAWDRELGQSRRDGSVTRCHGLRFLH